MGSGPWSWVLRPPPVCHCCGHRCVPGAGLPTCRSGKQPYPSRSHCSCRSASLGAASGPTWSLAPEGALCVQPYGAPR